MDEDTLYWLFSTIAQTYGAILGVIGMLMVYRLQNLSTIIKERMENSLIQRKQHFGEPSYSQSPEEFFKAIWLVPP